ncbi:MAG: 16S rRNA (cytosine(1402)-N(4))-methyltransferase RsmH [Acidimicrobiia bacterium]
MTDFHHEPVLVDKIVELFAPVPTGWVIDATVGGGGHAEAILASRSDLQLLGIDQDPVALAASTERLARFGDRVTLVRSRFDRLAVIMTDLRLPPTSAVLFDLGVSSPQLDRAERGFSYRASGPVDMRMDTDQAWSGSDVINGYTQSELAYILKTYGDERFADRIASAIVAARPIETTAELADIVRDAIPAPARRRGGHPAKRTFQAIRIEVNRELAILPAAMDAAIDATAPGGRVAVLTYHSGEDRIVKDRFRNAATGGCTCPPKLPCVCDAVRTVQLLKPGGWTASAAEIESNPRAESARLRAVERLRPAVGE